METSLRIAPGLELRIVNRPERQGMYATSSLPKGFRLFSDGLDLAEEAVGFGFPVVKHGLQALFPGRLELAVEKHDQTWTVEAVFTLNLEEKIRRPGHGINNNRLVYAIKNTLAALIRAVSPLRRTLTALSSRLREAFGWETIYGDAGLEATIKTTHCIDEETGKIKVGVELVDLPGNITEVVVMNEQGGSVFNQYGDSNRVLLQEEEIGCWDEVTAEKASFVSTTGKVAFRLSQVPGARLFRGRELVGSRLAWAGFGYSFPPSIKEFSYVLEIERLS
jgi:hypothetical protein